MVIIEFIKNVNNQIAMGLTKAMSSMACVYIFLIWALLPLVFPVLEQLCMYVSSTVIQLVALPLIMVGQGLLGKHQERRAKNDHLVITQINQHLNSLTMVNADQMAVIADLSAKIDRLQEKIN